MDDMRVLLLRVVLSAAVIAAVSCDVPAYAGASPTLVSAATPAGTAWPDPARQPKPDEAQLIVLALANHGVRGMIVFQSKFDWLFGSVAPRSGTFQGAIDGTQVWADVHFLDTPVDGITACVRLDPARETAFTVSVKGTAQSLGGSNVTGYIGSAGPMYFAVSQRVFVMTPDVRVRDALSSALALSVPGCIWREPATLPVLPWEREVMDALQGSGVQVRLVGGSKFESFLGVRREARHFGWSTATRSGGAEMLFLEPPVHEVRMCSSPLPSAQGFTRWTLRVDGKDLAGMEGSQTAYPLIGSRFFVLAFDADSAAVLSRDLGLSAPPC